MNKSTTGYLSFVSVSQLQLYLFHWISIWLKTKFLVVNQEFLQSVLSLYFLFCFCTVRPIIFFLFTIYDMGDIRKIFFLVDNNTSKNILIVSMAKPIFQFEIQVFPRSHNLETKVHKLSSSDPMAPLTPAREGLVLIVPNFNLISPGTVWAYGGDIKK